MAEKRAQPAGPAQHRPCARALLVDREGCVLLFEGTDPSLPGPERFWFTPGGGVEGDETLEATLRREVFEETGHRLGDEPVGPVVHRRRATFEFDGMVLDSDEHFFWLPVDRFEPNSDGWTDQEQEVFMQSHWWSVDELRSTDELVFPEQLDVVMARLLRELA